MYCIGNTKKNEVAYSKRTRRAQTYSLECAAARTAKSLKILCVCVCVNIRADDVDKTPPANARAPLFYNRREKYIKEKRIYINVNILVAAYIPTEYTLSFL